MQFLGPSAERFWTLVIVEVLLPATFRGILEAWILSPQQSDFGSLGLFDSTIDMDVFFLGSSVFRWVFFPSQE